MEKNKNTITIFHKKLPYKISEVIANLYNLKNGMVEEDVELMKEIAKKSANYLMPEE